MRPQLVRNHGELTCKKSQKWPLPFLILVEEDHYPSQNGHLEVYSSPFSDAHLGCLEIGHPAINHIFAIKHPKSVDLVSPKPESSHRANRCFCYGTPKCADHAALGHVLFIANSDVFRFNTYPKNPWFFSGFPVEHPPWWDPWIF
jgi:hypothetical protein